jgi:hypothetical protein
MIIVVVVGIVVKVVVVVIIVIVFFNVIGIDIIGLFFFEQFHFFEHFVDFVHDSIDFVEIEENVNGSIGLCVIFIEV